MKHISYDHWLQYVRDELNEKTRMEYENHLYSCDHCLERYLQAVEANEFQMPDVPDSFTDNVMKQIEGPEKRESNYKKEPKKKVVWQQTMAHYIVAAAVTLILMSTGVFSQLMNLTGVIENSDPKQSGSIVQSFLNNQDSFIDRFENNVKEGD